MEIWLAAGDDEYGRIVKLLMLTGQRRREISGLEWAEVRLQQAMIDLPPRRTKNRKRHLIPLSESALALLLPVTALASSTSSAASTGAEAMPNWKSA